MPIPVGTVPIGGPILDVSGALLTASPALRDANVVSFRGGKLRRVNAAGDDWEDVPSHIISATEPTEAFEGMLWYDTANDSVKSYDGSAFVALSGDGAAVTSGTADPTGGADGDAYFQLNASNGVISIWRNVAGTWTEYTVWDITARAAAATAQTAAASANTAAASANTAAASAQSTADGAVTVNTAQQTEIDDLDGGIADSLNSVALPPPTVSNVYDIIDHFGEAFANIPEAIAPVVAWDPSGDGDDVSDLWNEQTGTYRFRGIELTAAVDTPLSGDVVLLPTGSFRQRGATRWSHLGNPDGWRGGPYDDADEANHHVLAVNDVSAFDNSLQLATSFTAGMTHYQWVNIVANTPPSALVSRVLGTPTSDRLYEIQDFLGELYRVEPRPTGHVVTWDDYALLSDVSTLWSASAGTYRWRGETYPSGVINPATGDVIKEPAGHFRHRNSSNAWVHLVDPDDFIGDYNDKTAADNHVTAVGQTSLYSHLLHQVDTYTIGTPNYVWAKGLDAREVTLDDSGYTGNLAGITDVQRMGDVVDGLDVAEVAYALLPDQHWDTSYDAGLANVHSSDRQWYGQAVRIKGLGIRLTDVRVKYGENGGGEDNRWEVWGLTRVADNHYNFQEVLYTSADWTTVANVLHTQHLNLQDDPLEILSADYEYVGVVVNGFEIGRPPGFARRAYDFDDDPLNENDAGLADIIDYVAVLGHGSDLVPANNSAPAVGANVHRIHDHSIAMRLDFAPLLDVVGAHENVAPAANDQDASDVDVDATGFVGNLSASDDDVQTALDTIDGLDLSGGDAPDRIVLADAVGVSNTAGPHEIALTQALEPRQWLTFFAFTTTGAQPDGIGYLLSDDILALTAEATTPADAENSLPVVTASYSASSFSQQSGNYFVYRKDDSTLWVRPTRLAAHTLTITATPMGGGTSTAGQLAGGLTEQVIVGSRIATTEYGIGTVWTSVVDAISPTISPAIDPDNLLYISVLLRIDTAASIEVFISGAAIRRIVHTTDPLPSDAVSSDEIPGAYYSSRVPAGNADRGIAVNPTLSWMEARRNAGRFGVLFAFTDNAAGALTSIRPYVSANTEIDIDYIVAVVGA